MMMLVINDYDDGPVVVHGSLGCSDPWSRDAEDGILPLSSREGLHY